MTRVVVILPLTVPAVAHLLVPLWVSVCVLPSGNGAVAVPRLELGRDDRVVLCLCHIRIGQGPSGRSDWGMSVACKGMFPCPFWWALEVVDVYEYIYLDMVRVGRQRQKRGKWSSRRLIKPDPNSIPDRGDPDRDPTKVHSNIPPTRILGA